MPKKEKKTGEKQGETKKAPNKSSSETSADKTDPDNKEKDLYLTQIKYLTEQLERYQLKCDELERQKKDLISQSSTLEMEKKDVVEYLKRSLLEKEDEVDELLERLENQRRAADQDKDTLQLLQNQMRKELQDRMDELTKENTTLVERLSSLEEFQRQKEELMSNMESLEKQLENQKEKHKDDIHSLEMKTLLEKMRLEQEMKEHVAVMAAEVQQLVDQKVPETTRSVLQENVEVKNRLSLLSEQTQALMEENAALKGQKSRLSIDVDILEQMLSETSRTSCVRKKAVEQLTEKCQQLQTEQKESRQQLEQLQSKHTADLAQMETLRRDRASLSEQCSETRAEVSRLEAELQEERRRRSRMKSIMEEAADNLREALMESMDQDSEQNSWKQLMQKMLVVLERHRFTKSTAENDGLNEKQNSDSAAAKALPPDPELSFQFHLARYRPGDLGFIPRPAPKHRNALYRTGLPSSSTHVPLHRKPSSQKTMSSVKLTDSAVGLLISKHSKLK
ncbi:cilia- and flagella-associated protein 157 isoform X2 [Acanthochromis polyacanthus]|uniref:Cilia- and flagella-associated protein 157 n=1 Tax=Acanthochromis polyacanthus TaxID=80966 RepID=A0A3Q1EE75_9TELE|nr:cilia- and flagella-associated protein 157 isoform X2 [Acanthochromis polyacanthus]